jgi:hypothetical protein
MVVYHGLTDSSATVECTKMGLFIPVEEDLIMAPNLLFYPLLFVALVLICLIIHGELPDDSSHVPNNAS